MSDLVSTRREVGLEVLDLAETFGPDEDGVDRRDREPKLLAVATSR
jgi:hypothetical protein